MWRAIGTVDLGRGRRVEEDLGLGHTQGRVRGVEDGVVAGVGTELEAKTGAAVEVEAELELEAEVEVGAGVEGEQEVGVEAGAKPEAKVKADLVRGAEEVGGVVLDLDRDRDPEN